MLVLTRKPQEQIRVGEDVVITILRVKGQSVRIGIEAPPQVSLLRAELSPRQASSEQHNSEAPIQKKRLRSTSSQLREKVTNPFAAARPSRLTGASAFAGSVPGLLRQNTSGFAAPTTSDLPSPSLANRR
jgi:carbon storage regulator CsrA